MPVLIAFYLLAVGAILAVAFLSFRRLRRYGRLPAIAAGVATASTLLLLWPIPIHGGFTFLGEVAWHEWQGHQRLQQAAAVQAKRETHDVRLATRFRGELPVATRTTIDDRWAQVTTADGDVGWHDQQSGLIWSGWQPLADSPTLPDMAAADRRCAERAPRGYWALANEAEYVLLARGDGPAAMPPAPGSVVSYIAEAGSTLRLPTYRLAPSAKSAARRPFVVQCVARAAGSPARGYVREDIPLAEWNTFQLGKLARQPSEGRSVGATAQ